MAIEYYEKWGLVEGVNSPVARACLYDDHEGLKVRLLFSEIVGNSNRDLLIHFGNVPAYTVHEENVHPWNNFDAPSHPPRLEGQWASYFYPCLVVRDSIWLRSFSDTQLYGYENCTHYQLITMGQTVDVITHLEPQAVWVDGLRDQTVRNGNCDIQES